MKTNNEETILNQSETVNEQTVMNEECAESNEQDASVEVAPAKKNSGWKSVTISGVAGVMLGSASTLFAHEKLEEQQNNEESQGEDVTGQGTNTPHAEATHSDIHMASSVNDDMSFSEAFAAARHEVGAGGAFVWHGGVYGTYYGNEWNQLSPEEQQAFTANAMGTHHQTAATTGQSHTDVHSVASTDTPNHDDVSATSNVHTTTHETPHSTDDPEIQVLGVEENVVLEDGSVVNLGFAEVGGHAAMFIDSDDNSLFDQVIIDVNNNQEIDEQDIISEVNPDLGLGVDSFNQALNTLQDPVDDLYAQMPDYTNDANISDLA